MRNNLVWVVIVVVLLGIGVLIFPSGQERNRDVTDFTWHIETNNLSGDGIVWKDYPAWKTVDVTLSGDVKIWVPVDAEVVFGEVETHIQQVKVQNPEAWKEVSRETVEQAVEGNTLACDVVTYEAHNLRLQGKVMDVVPTDNMEYNEIEKALNGFYPTLLVRNPVTNELWTTCQAGVILREATEMQTWGQMENEYVGRNMAVYMDAFKVSRTYTEDNSFIASEPMEGIVIEKGTGTLFHYTILNQSGKDWEYSGDLPAVEFWYDGIWLELKSPYASNSMLSVLAAGESREVYTEESEKAYPYRIPGLYRLVVYGRNDEYITTTPFEITK